MALAKRGGTEGDYLTQKSLGGKVTAVDLRPDFADWNATDDFIYVTQVANLVSLLKCRAKTTQKVIER